MPGYEDEMMDVIVVGGGPAGIAATIAAARNGCKTLLIERYGSLGGELATGLPMLTFHDSHGRQVIGGIAQELVTQLMKHGGSGGHIRAPGTHVHTWTPSYPEVFKYVAQEMVLESGARLLYHSLLTDVVTEDGAISGVVVHNKSGRQTISGRVVVDTTGDGDVAAFSGSPFEKGRESDGRMQPVSLMFTIADVDVKTAAEALRGDPAQLVETRPDGTQWIRVLGSFERWQKQAGGLGPFEFPNHGAAMFSLREREVIFNTSKVTNVDATSVVDLTRAEIEARRQVFATATFLREYVPGFERSYLSATAPHIGIRETRRVIGEYILTDEDVRSCAQFPDAIALSSYGIDVHNPSGARGSVELLAAEPGYYGIPYRCLVPTGVDQLLVAGRCISASHVALGSVRVTVICMATGQAAGTAAALGALSETRPRDLDPQRLRTVLSEQGAIVGQP